MSNVKKFFVFDFETKAIGPRPKLMPPEPAGLAYKLNGGAPEYLAWNHPRGANNCTKEQAKNLFQMMIADPNIFFVAHNARFDVEVAEVWLGVKIPWERVIDTMVAASLTHPLAPNLMLKPLSEMLFGMASVERDEVRAWLIENKIVNRADKRWGAHIAQAPVEIVGPYACGDVERTAKINQLLLPQIVEKEMYSAFGREMRLSPHLVAAEQRGIRVNRSGLENAIKELTALLYRCDAILRVKLNSPNLNLDANDDLADALERAGKSGGFPRTPAGKRSTSKEALELAVSDPELRQLLQYRGMTATYLRTFAEPWFEASEHDGRIYPSWNSVRSDAGGTRTGRLSCSHPNLQNVPGKPPKPPEIPGVELAELPDLRAFLLPEPGHAWISADFNSQELRVLAHFAEGKLEQLFNDDPELDLHAMAAKMITERTGRTIERKATKIIAFSLIYGAGNYTMGARLGVDVATAAELRNAYYDALPGVRELIEDVKHRARNNKPVRTVGGRQLFAPLDATGRPKDYALVNYLIQGSAADQTKQTLIDWHRLQPLNGALFLTTVHDEINISAPIAHAVDAAKYLENCMQNGTLKLSVPMRATVKVGVNWGDCSK